ncbi:AEC family transporter [Sulfuricystis multivorans]|uniref:AEC family transporter n=1 Tax=Sulfuricystis multivorans TaxID=2211108 RepID=UPI000F82629B|nr:AEC family transporter [Sulfuricystis multivorans]
MNAVLTLLPDFALILLGLALRRWMALGDHFWTGVEKLVYFVLFPALLFNAMTKTPLTFSAVPLLATGAAAMAGAMLLAMLVRPLFSLTPVSFASQFQCAFRFNSYIGLAVAAKLHGAAGIAAMGLLVGSMVPLANLAAVGMLARHGETTVWRELAKNPLFLATLVSLAWNLGGLPVPAPFGQFLGRLAEAAIALGLLAVGAALKLRGAIGREGRVAAGYFLAVKLLAMPLIAWLVARQAGLGGVHFDVALVFAALPTASSAYILAQRMGGDGARVAWLISASTLMGMVTLPLWLATRAFLA